MALDQRGRLCWDDAGGREAGGCEERMEIAFCAFATADHQHQQIHKTRGAVGRIHDAVDKQERPVRTDGAARVAKDSEGVVVGPIVNNALQNVGVGTFGHGVEEIASRDLTSCGDIARQNLGSVGDDLRQIEQNTAEPWRGRKNVAQQRALAASHVH